MKDSIFKFFKTHPESPDKLSSFRLYLMRALYFLTFIGLGISVWPQIISPEKPLTPLSGVALSFWAVYSALSGLGIRYPLQMLPLMLLQLLYKLVWLLAISSHLEPAATAMTNMFVKAVVVDLIVIPWPYVFRHYFKNPGERWTNL